jgi:hypothetical protein
MTYHRRGLDEERLNGLFEVLPDKPFTSRAAYQKAKGNHHTAPNGSYWTLQRVIAACTILTAKGLLECTNATKRRPRIWRRA